MSLSDAAIHSISAGMMFPIGVRYLVSEEDQKGSIAMSTGPICTGNMAATESLHRPTG